MVRKALTAVVAPVIPGRCEASNPESRDSEFMLRMPPDDGALPAHPHVGRDGGSCLLRCICMPNIAPYCLTNRLRGMKLPPCTRRRIPRKIQPHSPRTPVRHG